jgi:general nucleoside transport system ATP-binding protein
VTPVLQLTHITKRFGTLVANDAISLHLNEGEILALLGENGAGKSTLVSILFGHYTADAGHIDVFGKPLPPGNPKGMLRILRVRSTCGAAGQKHGRDRFRAATCKS